MKRTLCILCALALCLTLMPTAAFAAGTDTGKAIQLGTSGISDPTSTQTGSGTHHTPSDYVYFGVNGSTPIKWRVLDADKANDGTTSGMFLLSEYLLDRGVAFESAWNSDDNDGQTDPNEWQYSDAQKWCSTFATSTDVFSTAEQAAFLGVAKTDSAESSLYSIPWDASSLTENDKVFFLSVRELADYVGSYDGAPGLRATDTAQSAGGWWLRSPDAGSTGGYAGLVDNRGIMYTKHVDNVWAARPAFNLDLNSVLLTSAAAGGKEGDGGLKAVTDYTDDEWKLTLLDDSRGFAISDAKTNASGDAIAFSYSGAQTGEKEYISVVIEEGGAITYYGRILQLDGTTNGASGTESLTLPAGTTLSGTTKLYVFNEQYNGGENDDTRLTDYGSRLIEVVNPTVDDTAPALSNDSATRDSDTTATVKFTSDEAGTYYYIAQDTEITLTKEQIAAQGTQQACKAGENEIELDNLTASAWYVAVVVKDAVGNVSEILNLTIPAPTYTISASPATLDFGSKTVGYTEAPDAQTVTVTNTGNQTVTVNLPAGTNYIITAGDGFTNDTATLAPGNTAAFTVQPNTGLAVGSHSETLTISGSNGAGAEISLAFTVEPISIENAQVNVAGEYTYDGDEIVPESDNVTVTLDGETLEADTDYTLAYSDNINAGTATVTVTGTGNYTGTATGNFTINKGEWTGVKTVEGIITPGIDGSVTLPAVPDGAALGTPAGDPEVENIAVTGNVLSYTGGSGIENGKTYTVTVPVGETANYLAYDITVSLAGDTGSGLAQTAAGALRVFGTDGMLHITGTAAEAAVHDVRGVLVYRGTARTIHLPAGVYIVRAEGQVRKAVVK